MMKRIKKFLKDFPLTKTLYHKIASKRYQRRLRKKAIAMKKNGKETIALIQNALQGRCFFFFDMGTLLGIVREGNLIGHDLDIDVAVYVESDEQIAEIRRVLGEHHCTVKFSYAVPELGAVEDSFEVNGIKFDINYYTRETDADVCYLMYRDPQRSYTGTEMNVVKLVCDPIRETVPCSFFGTMINIPANAEHYLAQRYGENWRVPDKKWVYWKGPSTRPTEYIGQQKTNGLT